MGAASPLSAQKPSQNLMTNHRLTIDSDAVRSLARHALPHAEAIDITDANRGNGVFSRVLRVHLSPKAGSPSRWLPPSVIVKVPAESENRAAAVRSGAYHREALAYEHVLTHSPVRTPGCWLIEDDGQGGVSFVLEDLDAMRFVDQDDGMSSTDAVVVVTELARFHANWSASPGLESLPVRRAAVSSFRTETLEAGLAALDSRWGDTLDASIRSAFGRLVQKRDVLVRAFEQAGQPTLCHGDPRAANLAFDHDGSPVLFDWQQMAVQFGEADVAWLAGTSLESTERRQHEAELIEAYGGSFDRYRLGFVLPGLAVLMLALREHNQHSRATTALSLQRIGAAVVDLQVWDAASG